MYLSNLEIIGFKSFANKTKMEFTDGMSCIIGPNGSGKSNIVDAIRWVLGEQRVTSLRSDRMENVLFNGTRLRKPIGMAEVSMTIQNNKNILKTEFEEVVVSRRLYRSGESQYLINKTPVRLRDILDLFVDTGMGANSYSVIELKMVESILSENTSERRQLFEEAAGIVKYKIRRRSALRKLEATHADLLRISDIISEISKNVNTLSRQVGKARRYLAYADELKKTEINLYRYRFHQLTDAIRPLQLQLQEVFKLKEASHHQITIDEALLENYKRDLLKTDHEFQEVNKKIQEIDAKVAQLSQDQAVASTKSEEITKTKNRYLSEIEEFGHKIKLYEENLYEYEHELTRLSEKKEFFDLQYSEIEKKRQEEVKILLEKKNHIEVINEDYKKSSQTFSREQEQLRQKEYQVEFYNEQLTSLGDKIQSFEETFKYLEKKNSNLKNEKENIEKDIGHENEKLAHLAKESLEYEEQLKSKENERAQLFAEIEKVKSRQNFFEQIISHYEGHSTSTQFAMTNKAQIPGIYGPLSDIISIEDRYSWAVETILGDALNYILVEDVDVAKKMINLIRENKKGRITLIPLAQINKNGGFTAQTNGNITLLPKLIQCDERYQNLINILLGDVAMIDTFEEAISQSSKYPHLRFVTLDGEMVNFNRELSGGSIEKKSATLIGRKDQLKKIRKELSSLEGETSKIAKQIEKIEHELNQRKIKRQELEAILNQNKNRLIDLDKKESQYEFEIQKLKDDQKGQEDRLIGFQDNIKILISEIGVLSKTVQNNQLLVNQKEKKSIDLTHEYEKHNQSLQILIGEVQKAQLEVTNLQNQIANRENDIIRSKALKNELLENISNRSQEIMRIEELLEQIHLDSVKRQEEQIKIWESRDQLESELDSIQQKSNEIRNKIDEIEAQTKQYRRQHDSSLERSRALELQINENSIKAENLREFIRKEYAEDIEIGIPFTEFNAPEAEDRIQSLRERIKNLGPVNPLAVSEYEKEKERLDFLTGQREDLSKAESSLKETITKINKTARKQFLETFTAIKQNFEHVFRSFFENGEGTVELQESTDPLESDIEINVRTKGKKLQTLSLLSGGEKTLTAISLLFAIYLVKPSPFCILDEVDAPLDDVNILRFTEALKNFSKNTQFIVVTHNKRTMEAAQTLYGVTMEEEGVSKLVSVKFI